ncbi:proton-conducting transporter transmembrane domain-containing protein [Polystyrenella longa]
MPELHLPWLELSILLPLLGACWLCTIRNPERARRFSIAITAITFVFSCGEWIDFISLKTYEAHDHWDLISTLFGRNIFVVDELSAPLLPLGALLYFMTVLSTLRTKVNRFSFSWTLFSECILLATLSCREPWGVIALLSVATIPPWVEMKSRSRSTRAYTLHMSLFVVLMIVGQLTLDLSTSVFMTTVAGAILTAAALVRTGVLPLHCWITDLFEKVTFGTALLYVTPMTGAYLVMRLILPIAPDWALQSIAVVSLVTAVYAGGMALIQQEARRFFCYLFLSHSSLVLVGLELATSVGLTGALCVWLSVGLSLAGFGLTLRCVEARRGRISLAEYQGLYEHTPILAAFFMITGLASIGFPGTIGFIGTELLIEGAVDVYPLVGTFVVIAAALNGIAILSAYFRIFTGNTITTTLTLKARPAERIAVLVLAALILGGGLYPQPGVESRYHAAKSLMTRRQENLNRQTQITNDWEQAPTQQDYQNRLTHENRPAISTMLITP